MDDRKQGTPPVIGWGIGCHAYAITGKGTADRFKGGSVAEYCKSEWLDAVLTKRGRQMTLSRIRPCQDAPVVPLPGNRNLERLFVDLGLIPQQPRSS